MIRVHYPAIIQGSDGIINVTFTGAYFASAWFQSTFFDS